MSETGVSSKRRTATVEPCVSMSSKPASNEFSEPPQNVPFKLADSEPSKSAENEAHDFEDIRLKKPKVILDDKSPRRAEPPFLVVCAVALWVSCAASFYFSRQVPAELENYLVVALFALLIICVLAAFAKRFRRQFLIASFLVLGLLLGVGQNAKLNADCNSFAELSGKELHATLFEDSSVGDYGVSAVLDVDTGTGKHLRVSADFSEGVSLLNGEKVTFSGTFKSFKAASRDYYFNKGICCQVKVSKFSVVDATPLAFIIFARK
ncbi:MAG: hypothetical protein Q3982_04640, partial [Phoenicibacter congonensis]|nr:hypothetical protein [Phoenicibacter congonensis]